MSNGHLSEEQFADWLAGERQNQTVLCHLGECRQCRRELEATEEAMLAFNHLGTAWSAVAAPQLVRPPSRLELQLGGRPAWGLAVAAMVAACLMAIGLNVRNSHLQGAAAAAASASATPSRTELAEDNELMESINQELNYRASPAIPAVLPHDHLRHREDHFAPAVINE